MPGPKYEKVQNEEETISGLGNSCDDDKVQIVHSADDLRAVDTRQDIVYTSLITTSVISCYFVLSITLTFYNQRTFKVNKAATSRSL